MIIAHKNLLKIGLYSNAIYVFLLFLFKPNGVNFEKIVISGFLMFSVLIIFYLTLKNLNALKEIPNIAKYIFYLLIFWSSVVVIRGFTTSIQDWVTNFGNVYMGLAWFTPCVLLLGNKIKLWNIVFKALLFMFVLMIIAFLIEPYVGRVKTEWTWLLRPINFVLIIGLYKKSIINKLMMIVIMIIYIVIAIKVKQRVEFIFLFMVLVFSLIDKLKHIKIKRYLLKYILFGFILFLLIVFTYGYENVSHAIELIIEFQDSRTFLFQELLLDLNPWEKVFGRGSLGTYYSDFFERTRKYYEITGRTAWAGDVPDRITTEVGYLQMILKGGFLLFGFTAFFMFYSAFLGIFRSNNKFCKNLGFYILILSILSLISFRPAFTPIFIILWLSIGTVLNKKNRSLSNEEIYKLFKI